MDKEEKKEEGKKEKKKREEKKGEGKKKRKESVVCWKGARGRSSGREYLFPVFPIFVRKKSCYLSKVLDFFKETNYWSK